MPRKYKKRKQITQQGCYVGITLVKVTQQSIRQIPSTEDNRRCNKRIGQNEARKRSFCPIVCLLGRLVSEDVSYGNCKVMARGDVHIATGSAGNGIAAYTFGYLRCSGRATCTGKRSNVTHVCNAKGVMFVEGIKAHLSTHLEEFAGMVSSFHPTVAAIVVVSPQAFADSRNSGRQSIAIVII